jgi:hypothetical protein
MATWGIWLFVIGRRTLTSDLRGKMASKRWCVCVCVSVRTDESNFLARMVQVSARSLLESPINI